MRISFNEQIDGGRVIQSIGRVRATTSWHAPGAACAIGVDYETDDVESTDLSKIDLQRITATGIAVKLARA
jgi:hypothetical protein